MTKTQKKILKEKLFKLLHFVSYVLSILFIVVIVIASCTNCKKQNNNNNQTLQNSGLNLSLTLNNDTYSYEPRYSSGQTTIFDSSVLNSTMKQLTGVGSGPQDYTLYDTTIKKTYEVDDFYFEYEYINECQTYYFTYEFRYLLNSSGSTINSFLRLYKITFDYYALDGSFNSLDYMVKFNDYATGTDSNKYLFQAVGFNYFIGNVEETPLLLATFDIYKCNNFLFNDQINYNAPLGLTLNNNYGYYSFDNSLYRIKYTVNWFYSNGRFYNEIWVDYMDAGSLTFDFDGTKKLGPSGQYSYFCMIYNNTENNYNNVVNMRDTENILSGSSYVNCQLKSSTWTNQAYKNVNFLFLSTNSTKYQNLAKFNNNNQSIYNGGSLTGGYDIFSFFGNCFVALVPFFACSILPGITIGVLFFIPLVVMIIFAIIRILRK